MHILIIGIGSLTRDFARNWPEPVLARALQRAGHRVTAVGYLEPTHPAMTIADEEIDGITVIRVPPELRPDGTLARRLDDLPRPDIVHLFHLRNVLVWNATRWAQRRGIPIVHSPVGPYHDAYLVADRERPYESTVHVDHLAYDVWGLLRALAREPRPQRQWYNYLLHAPLRHVTRFIASSHHEQRVLHQMGFDDRRSEVIPLWIEPATPVAPDHRILSGISGPMVLFIGQLTPRKGCDRLIEAMPAITTAVPGVHIVVVSHNPAQQAHLSARAAQLGVDSQLRFVGRVSEAQKVALMAAAACLVVPSRYEGFGLPLLEAMQAGVPLVASAIPVIDEIVTDGIDGLLVDAGEPSALAAGIVRLLRDPVLRQHLIVGGQHTITTRFAEPALLAQVCAAYRQTQREVRS
jgi:glycogen(starch) synthase